MRPLVLLIAALSVCATVRALPAEAQVTLNLDAIDQQGKPQAPAARGGKPATQRPAAKPAPAARGATQPAGQNGTPAATTAQPAGARGRNPAPAAPAAAGAAAATATGAAAAIALPAAPEPTPVIPPPPAPTATPAPPPRPATVANATTAVAALREGVRVTFEAGKSDLSPVAAQALAAFAKKAPREDSVTFNVAAYAAGNAEDPSTPRRLALARALAIRTALMAEGIASTRIYVRAVGAGGDVAAGPADRVDISVLGMGAGAAVAKP